jgi:hypothetical protein
MKKALIGSGIFVTVTVVMFIIGELVVRALYADETVLFPRYHTDVQYGEYTIRRIRPNSTFWHTSVDGQWQFVTNSRGFRNYAEFDYEKPADTLRVLSLGDSHTQGYEVRQEHTFSAVIKRYLAKQGIRSEVINAGVSGFGTAEQLILLENEGLKYKPDVVVLAFYRNDLEDNTKSRIFRLDEDGALIANNNVHIPGVRAQNAIYAIPGVKWLGENSYFYSIMFNTTWEIFKNRLSRRSAEQVTEYAIPQKAEYSRYEVGLTAALLDRLYRTCVQNGIKLILIDVPIKTEDGGAASSFPAALHSEAARYSDVFLDSDLLFGDYSGVAEVHVPHGAGHISEFAHAHIGIAAGRAIETLYGK